MELKTPIRIVTAKYNNSFCIEDADGNTIADDGSAFGEHEPKMNADIARRFVACVNACEGFPTEELEEETFEDVILAISKDHVAEISKLVQQRDHLLAELKKLSLFAQTSGGAAGQDFGLVSAIDDAAHAIATVEQPEFLDEFPWVMWHGGERPVPSGTNLEIRLRNGLVRKMKSEDCCWNHPNPLLQSFEIVAYRVVDPAYRVESGGVANYDI